MPQRPGVCYGFMPELGKEGKGTADCVPSKQALRAVLLRPGILRSGSAEHSCAVLRIRLTAGVVGWKVLQRVLRRASAKRGCRSGATVARSKWLCELGLAGRPAMEPL